jgi:RIO kinase 1
VDETYDENRVEDEDWEIAERGNNALVCSVLSKAKTLPIDFTKQYNRFRQHVAVRTGSAQGTTSSLKQGVSVAPLPVINQPKRNDSSAWVAPKVGVRGDRTADQLAALSKYNSRLSKIDAPYVIGVGVNRKGPSAHANMKDKSDRATSEQVLDPRTRLILFKMIGRGLVHEINGCISTGKEVLFDMCSI